MFFFCFFFFLFCIGRAAAFNVDKDVSEYANNAKRPMRAADSENWLDRTDTK